MHELLMQLLAQARGMWRYRWHALLATWVVTLAGWALVFALPNQYEARARVYVDTQSVLKPLLRDLAVDTDVQSRVAMMTRALLSRPNLAKVARTTDLDLRAETPKEMERLLARLQKKIEILGSQQVEHFYTITYTDRVPQMAQRVVQTLLNVLVEDTLGSSRTDAVIAQRFLDQQIREYEARLTAAEERLAQFKKQHVGMMPSQGGDYYTRLQSSLDGLEHIRSKLKSATNRRDELRKQLAGEEPVFGIVSPAGTFRPTSGSSALDVRIQGYRKQLDNLLLQYTDRHPDVVALKEIIARLEKRRQVNQRALRRSQSAGKQRLELNPVYQNMQIALNEAEVEVVTLQAQLTDRQARVDELKEMVDTIPEVEANLARLNRDYTVTKSQYEALLTRLESARLSEDAEQSRDDVEFRIIEPPIAPLEPVGPFRSLFLPVVLVVSLLAGSALAFFLNEARPVFVSSRVLHEVTNLPVLGAVSMRWMPKQKLRLRRELALFVLTIATLVFTCTGAIIFQDEAVRVAHLLIWDDVLV